jgi:hypothetical protein
MAYKINKKYDGKRLSLFIAGLPTSIVLNAKTPQKVLKILNEKTTGIVEEDGSDNKK